MSQRKERIVFIGNSIVNGFPLKRSESFPSRFRELSGLEVINKGVNGDTALGVAERFASDVLAHKPDRFYLLTGTNDCIQGTASTEGIRDTMAGLVREASARGIQGILLTPLPIDPERAALRWLPGIDYTAVDRALADLARSLLDLAASSNMLVLDTRAYFRQLLAEGSSLALFSDGIHPTAEGHRLLAEFLLEDHRTNRTPISQSRP